ncbi:MAG: hypothetical protein AAF989_02130, partial [Planctomycetota bacterium]
FRLPDRFEQEVASPLRGYLDSNPSATPDQLIDQFDFLEAIDGGAGSLPGVKFNLDFTETLQKPLESLLRPLTQFGGPFQVPSGDALSDLLSLEISTEDFDFQVTVDGEDVQVQVPNFSLNVGNAEIGLGSIAGQIGLLAGTISDPQIDLDLGWRFDAGSLFGGGLGAIAPPSLDSLQSVTANSIIQGFQATPFGEGLSLNFPFDFTLPGFDTGGFLPQLVASDDNPLDDIFPVFDILVPEDAPYDLDSLLGMVDLSPSGLLAMLDDLGDVFEQIQSGSLLNVKVPFTNDVTVGEALGLAEGFATGVLNFIKTGEGLPSFTSLQEFIALIPGIEEAPMGPQLPSPVRYNPESKTLDISLGFVRDPDPLLLQADLNLFAGSPDAPFAQLLVDDVNPDTGEVDESLNRVQITRSASIGLDLQIDLSLKKDEAIRRQFKEYDASLDYRVKPWTRLDEFAQRFGFADELGLQAVADVVLRDGSVGVLNFGVLDPSRTIGDLLDQGKVIGGTDITQGVGETTRAALYSKLEGDLWQIVDQSADAGTTSITPQRTPDTAHAFWDNLFGNNAVAFNQLESTNGAIESRLLRGSFLDGHLTPTTGTDSETPLRWLFPVAGPQAGLLQGLQPIVAHLRDGRDVTISFSDLDAETIESLLPTLSADIGGEQVLEANIVDERIVIRDLTSTSGNRKFRLEWVDQPGWSILSQILDIGEDDDRDGKLIGPRLIPALTNDLRPAVSADTLMSALAAQYGVDATVADRMEIRYRDGRTAAVTSASYDTGETLGDFIDFFNEGNDDSSLVLFQGKLRLHDATDGPDGVRTFITSLKGGLFSKLFGGDQINETDVVLVDLDYDRVIQSRTLTTNGVSHQTPVIDLLPAGIDLRNAGEVRIDLRNGDSITLPPLDLADVGNLADVLDEWSAFDRGQQVLAAALIDGRVVLQDLTTATGNHEFRIRIFGDATVEGSLLRDARDANGRGRIAGRELFQAIPAVPDAPVRTLVDPIVPVWTKIASLSERMRTQGFANGLEQLQVELSDGTVVRFSASSEHGATLAQLIDNSPVYRAGALIAELKLEERRLVLVDHTDGAQPIRISDDGQSGIFLQQLFQAGRQEASQDGTLRWVSGPLGETILATSGANTQLRFYSDDPFHPMFGNPSNPALGSPLEFRLRDGTVHETGFFNFSDVTLRAYLDQLTVQNGDTVLMQPEVIDGRIVLMDRTEGDGLFSVVATASAIDQVHRRFLHLGTDVDGNGELIGAPFLAPLPSINDPIRDSISLKTLLEPVGGSALTSTALGTTASASIRLRDGGVRTLEIAPLGEDATLADLLAQLRLVENEQVVFEVALGEGRLLAADLIPETQQDGATRFTIQDTDSDANRLFTLLGLSRGYSTFENTPLFGDVDDDGIITGATLYNPIGPDFLTVQSLELGDIQSDNSTVSLSLRDGTQRIVTIGALADDDDLLDVIDRLDIPGVVRARFVDGRVMIEDLTEPTGEDVFSIDFGDPGFTYPTTAFLPLSIDLDNDGRIFGPTLIRGLPVRATGPETLLDELATRFGLPEVSDVEDVVVEITLRNGLQVTQPLKVHPGMSIREFLSQLRVVEETPTGPNVLFDADVVDINGASAGKESPRWRVLLRDFTQSVDGTGETQVRRLQDQENFGSMLPTFLGIYGRDVNNTGVIVGGSMELVDDSERVRIKLTDPPILAAAFEATATDVTADARVGGLASASLRNGQGLAAGSVQLQVVPPIGRDFVTVNDLIGAVGGRNNLLKVELDTDLQFGADLALDLGGLNEQFTDPGEVPRVDIAWPDFITNEPNIQIQFDTLDVGFSNAENLFKLKDLSLQDITNLIRKVVDLVGRISGDDLLNKQLPLVNTSIGEVLDTVDYVDDLVMQTIEDPDASLKTLESLLEDSLGLQDSQLTLLYDEVNNAIKIELDLAINPDSFRSSLNLDLSDVGLAGLDQLVDFQATGAIDVTAGADLNLDLGINLDALGIQRLREEADRQNPNLPPTADFDDVILVYGTTGVVATARAAATDLSFNTAIGPLSVDVGPGAAVLDADGLAFGGTGNNDPANLTIGLPDENQVYEFSSLAAGDFTLDFQASAGLDLPLQFSGLDGPVTEQLQLHWPDIDLSEIPSFNQVGSIDTGLTSPNAGRQVVLPNLAGAIGAFDASDGVFALVAGLEGLFNLIEGYLGDEILGVPVPLIGDGLSAATGFLDDLRGHLTGAIDSQGSAADLARAAMFEALGPNGLNVLEDLSLDGVISILDVGIIPPGDPDSPQAAEGEGTDVFFRLKLGGTFEALNTGLNLDVGIPALGLEIDGDIALDVGWQVDVGFGLSQADGVFIQFFGDDEIKLGFKASIDDLAANGRLGPVALSASTIDAEDLTQQQRLDSRLSPDDASTENINALAGRYNIDLGDGRIGLAELGGYLTSPAIETEAQLAGSLHLDVLTGLDTEARMPAIATQLHVTWPSVQGTLADAINGLATPEIAFDEVALDLGSFISDIIGPALQPVNDMIDPIRPILDALTTPIPVISDLAGEVTFVDLMGLFGSGGESVAQFVEAAATIADLIDVPVVNGNVRIPLGSFSA